MSNTKTSTIFISSVKVVLIHLLKITALLFVWTVKAATLILSKTADMVERIIIKRS